MLLCSCSDDSFEDRILSKGQYQSLPRVITRLQGIGILFIISNMCLLSNGIQYANTGKLNADGSVSGCKLCSCSTWHAIVITDGSNEVYGWGWNKFGQLGSQNVDVSIPIQCHFDFVYLICMCIVENYKQPISHQ